MAVRVAVMGAGAVGSFLGARLARCGVDVTLIARGAHLAALQQYGLRVESPTGDLTVAVPAAGEPSRVGVVDLVLFCVKSYDTEAAAAACRPLVGSATTVLVLQNGVDNEEKVAAQLGWEPVVSGVIYIGVELVGPGVIHHHDGGTLQLGELDGRLSERVRACGELFRRAGLPCEVVDDIQVRKWEKFLFNCALNAMTALTGRRLPALLALVESRRLFEEAVREAARVARRHGIALRDDAEERVLSKARSMDIASSMLTDLQRGRPLEVEAFNGVVVRLGRRHGVATPVHEVLYALLKAADPATGPVAAPAVPAQGT